MDNESNFNHLSLSLIIPVYNEEESIKYAIESNLKAIQSLLSTYEIIIVNDGSTDTSQMIIDETINGNLYIRSLLKEQNEGIGSAIRLGVKHAQYDYILPVPVDCPLDNESLNNFLENIKDNDIVVGYRPVRVGYSLRMRINSYVFHKLIVLLFNIELKDFNWIHLYKRKIFTENAIDINSNGIAMLAEVLIKSLRKKLKITEIEIVQRERLTGVATASRFITVLKTIKEIFVLYLKIR